MPLRGRLLADDRLERHLFQANPRLLFLQESKEASGYCPPLARSFPPLRDLALVGHAPACCPMMRSKVPGAAAQRRMRLLRVLSPSRGRDLHSVLRPNGFTDRRLPSSAGDRLVIHIVESSVPRAWVGATRRSAIAYPTVRFISGSPPKKAQARATPSQAIEPRARSSRDHAPRRSERIFRGRLV